MAEADQSQIIRFGLFEVDLSAGELRKNGARIKLQDQPFRVLSTLLQHPGSVVTREELRQELWPADTFVDFEHGLNAAVKRLRDALGESAENPIFIETLARRGYRFNAPVDRRNTRAIAEPLISPPATPHLLRRRYLFGLVGFAVAIVAVAAVWNLVGINQSRTAAGGEAIHSLAVLPLENLSRDPEQEYFSDGMTEALISQLSKIGPIRVISRTSSMRYKGTNKSLPEIARELNVDGVIEGSVMRSGSRVRIVVQLIQGRSDQHLWTEMYERDLSDVLRLQSEVAQAVALQVRIELTPAERSRLRSASAVNSEAYEAYLKGRSHEYGGTQVALRQAQAYFEEAVRTDPKFALGYVGLADTYLELGDFRWLSPQEAYRRGSEAIHKALSLDEGLAEAHSTLGYLDWEYGWNWEEAERELRSAIDLYPNYLVGHEFLLSYLASSGRHREAMAEVETMRRLDPVFPSINLDDAHVYYHQRDYKSLVDVALKSVAANPNLWLSHYFLAVGYEGSGRPAQAVPEYQKAVELSQRDSDTIAGLAHVYAIMGRVSDAQKLLGELQRQSRVTYASPYMIAAIYSGLGQKEKALEFLEKAYQEKSPDLAYFLRADLRMDALRSDPRFQDIWRRVGLPR